MIDGFDNNPSARLEHAFHEIAAKSMAGLPFYRQHIPIKACGFQRFEGQMVWRHSDAMDATAYAPPRSGAALAAAAG